MIYLKSMFKYYVSRFRLLKSLIKEPQDYLGSYSRFFIDHIDNYWTVKIFMLLHRHKLYICKYMLQTSTRKAS